MKTYTTQQEVLLHTQSTFFQQELCEQSTAGKDDHVSPADKLEEGCWNGLLGEWLPEVMSKSISGKRLFVWHIRQGEGSLQVHLSDATVLLEKEFSIDPNLFLPLMLTTS